MTRLPPLGALRAFEAAARLGSVGAAARELNVTHSAVSHQVGQLEEALGVPLFRRQGRGIEATPAGQRLFPPVRDAFAALAAAVEAVRRDEAGGVLTVSVEPSFAARWLVLRLGRFREVEPGVELRLVPTEALTDFAREGGADIDCAVRYGRGGWPGLAADRLMGATLFPVCGPALGLAGPGDLATRTLLHEDAGSLWREWLAAAGVAGVDWSRGPRFATAHLTLAAAAAGQGVALADEALVAEDLAAGRLVRPLELAVPTGAGYWLVRPPRSLGRPKVEAFRRWLLAEAEAGAD